MERNGGKEEHQPAANKKLKLADAVSVLRKNSVPSKENGDSSSVNWLSLQDEDSQIESSLPRYLGTIFGFKETSPNKETLQQNILSSGQTTPLDSATNDDHSPLLFHSPETNSPNKQEITPVKSTIAISHNKEYAPPPGCLLLSNCNEIGQLVSVLAVVTQVNPMTEINIKNGAQSGETVVMSSILISDPSLPNFKLSLWREAAEWVERLTAGDIILLSNIRIKEWRKELVGHTVMISKLLNLHQTRRLPKKIIDRIPEHNFSHFYSWASRNHFNLFNSQTQHTKNIDIVEFKKSEELYYYSMVHFRAKLVKIIENKVLLMSDGPSKFVTIHLIGRRSKSWMSKLKLGAGLVWESCYLLVLPQETQSGYCSLQTSSRTSFMSLDSKQPKAQEILTLFDKPNMMETTVSISQLKDISQSGLYRVKAKATTIRFVLECGDVVDLLSLIEMRDYHKMVMELKKCIYVGCAVCSDPLVEDENNDYSICSRCPSFSSSKKSPTNVITSVHYFKPLSIVLTDSSHSSSFPPSYPVTITSSTLNKLLPNECASNSVKDLNDFSNTDQINQMGVAVSGCVNDLIIEREWLISLEVSCDENSFIMSLTANIISIEF